MRLFSKRSIADSVSLDDLPQPSCPSDPQRSSRYRYVTEVHTLFSSQLTKDQPVWVTKSKGVKTKRQKLFCRALVADVNVKEKEADVEDNRVVVQYSKGSTYAVRRDRLVPIYGRRNDTKVVMVWPETDPYRRGCVTHTGSDETFWEIGCAEGITCHRVWAASDSTATPAKGESDIVSDKSISNRVVGIDKSEISIVIARRKYESCQFVVCDILHELGDLSSMTPPDVVAIDINGNRELEAVLSCLQVVMDNWNPRLILVKSRSLFYGLPHDESTRKFATEFSTETKNL